MLALFTVIALISSARATVPTCAILLGCAEEKASSWINGAQDSAIVVLQTLFGGFLNGKCIAGCFSNLVYLDTTLCIDNNQFPEEKCARDGCNLDRHIEFFDPNKPGCCVACNQALEPNADPPSQVETRVCRSIRQWIAIALNKLEQARDFYDAQDYENAISYACAAEYILSLVIPQLPADFSGLVATYRHIIGAVKTAAFDPQEDGVASNDLHVAIRTIQSFRKLQSESVHSLVATYSTVTVLQHLLDSDGQDQLLWPISGSISSFANTHLSPTNQCFQLDATDDMLAQDDINRRLPDLGDLDYAVVVDAFVRCDAFPRAGNVRRVNDLSFKSCCNTLALVEDLDHAAKLLQDDANPTVVSFVYVAHRLSVVNYEATPTRNVHIEESLLMRIATTTECRDFEPSSITSLALTKAILAAPAGIPLTLAPGQSQCVGGDRAGMSCSRHNECGAGLTCKRRKRNSDDITAYCFDGAWWNEAMPCSQDEAVNQCPYGECFGAIDGKDSGLAHVWKVNNCDDPELATPLCQDQSLVAWFDEQN